MRRTAVQKKPVQYLDPAELDPAHYEVEFENEDVRVLRIRYGPHEKSGMHDHPDGVAIFLTDQHSRFTYPGGETEEVKASAGQVRWMPAFTHMPENVSGRPMELILVEMKK